MQNDGNTLLCNYRYDPLDRLVNCILSKQVTNQRFYLKDRLTTEIQDTLHQSIFQYEDRLLAQHQRQGELTETSVLATDEQRTVLHGASAGSLHTFTYAPYGHRAVKDGRFGLLGFNGELPDTVTEHYLLGNGYRAFNPVLMRFNSPDSLSPFGSGGVNAYAYCAGDPINRIDPDGHVFILGTKLGRLSQSAPDLFKRSPSTVISTSTRRLSEVPSGGSPISLNRAGRRSTSSEGGGSFSGGSGWGEYLTPGAGRRVSTSRSSSEGSGSFSGGSQWGEYIGSRAPTSVDSSRASSLYPESSVSSGSTRSSVSFESPRMSVDLDFLGSAESPLSKVQKWLEVQQVPTSARPIDKIPQTVQRVRRQR